MSTRRGSFGRTLLAALVVVALFAGAVAGVTWFLNRLDSPGPFQSSCRASHDGESAVLAPDQTANAALIAAIGVARGLPARAVTIALATAMQESQIRNIDYGDRDSVGMFQQRPSQGWGTVEQIMDPVYSTNAFYDVLITIDGYQDMEITDAAQAVQRSGFPKAYAQHEQMARLFASALTGWSSAALACQLGDDTATTTAMELAGRDLPFATLTSAADGDSYLSMDPTLVGDSARALWVLAHWAVATSELTGVSAVTVGDQRWSRADGADAAWTITDAIAPDGVVVVR